MKHSEKEENGTCGRQTLDSWSSRSALLLSVVCSIALIHTELRIQEHHRLISQSVTVCDQMESNTLKDVQGNEGKWKISSGSHLEANQPQKGRVAIFQDHKVASSRQKRASPDESQQKATQTTSEIKMLIREELRLLQDRICAKDKTLCLSGPKGSTGRRGRRGARGRPGPIGRLGPEGPPGKHGPTGPQGPMGLKGDLGSPGDSGPEGPRGLQGEKGTKGEQGKSISAPFLLQRPVEKAVNEGQTANLKCTADGNPTPQVTWSKTNSSLPVGRHVVESSGTLVVKNVRPGDEGFYICRAVNLLGSVNATARLNVYFDPQVLLSSKTVMTEENQTVTITCNAIGQPHPSITWSKSVRTLPKGRNKLMNGALTIYNVAKEDRGSYICKAENSLGSASDAVQLMVFSPLRFNVLPPQEVTPLIGYTLRLPCEATSNLRPTTAWTKNGKSTVSVESNVLRNGTLILKNIKMSDQGSYTCKATNALTTIETKVQINAPLVASSCSVIRNHFSNVTGKYVIDPDGKGGLAPFTVLCDMSDKNGVGVTVINQDSESRTKVRDGLGWGDRGSYSRDIHYSGASLSQLASLTRVSSHCEQFIKYECYNSVLRLYTGNPFGWWVSRHSSKMSYWGGASVSGKCACGMTNSCANPSYGCNCDKNDQVWREDSGLLTDKTMLPVKQLRFGDVGDSRNLGYHTLGKLKCYGTA